VAVATWGLLGVLHIPNVITFFNGVKSLTVPAGTLLVFTILVGSTTNWLGLAPKVHIRVAPLQTSWVIISLVDDPISVGINSS
jgi:hypothetical protein